MLSSHMQVWASLFCTEAKGGPQLSLYLPNRLKSLPGPCMEASLLLSAEEKTKGKMA